MRQDIWGVGKGASLELVTPPTGEPVTLDQAKADRRLDNPDSDGHLTDLLLGARMLVEKYLGRQLMPAVYTYHLDRWHLPIYLPMAPISSIDEVTYYDTQGLLQTLDPSQYQADLTSRPPRLLPAFGTVWPWVRWLQNAVAITYHAGYADAASVPMPIKRAILMLAGQWFEVREPVGPSGQADVPFGIAALLLPYRVPMVFP